MADVANFGAFPIVQPADFLASYQRGLQTGDALKQRNEQQQLNQMLAQGQQSGDVSGAENYALQTGNFDYYDRASKLHDNQLAQAQQRVDAIAKAAYSLKQLPAEQRGAAFQTTFKPMLQSLGVDPQHLSQVDLSDAGLDGYIGQALDLKTQMEQNKPVVVGKDSALIAPNNGHVLYKDNSPDLQFIPSTNPITGQTVITVGDKNTGALGPDAMRGIAPAPTGAAPAAAAPSGSTATPTTAATPSGLDGKRGAVASVLSASMPAPVVAGFLGNFDMEGGYNGAAGDGGISHGIAQLNGSRLANFQQMFGKDPAQATPEEQAQFVAWEMQHPEAAGMTVAQRDAILAAPNAGVAASLIDKFYERSDGTMRRQRVAAANRYAGLGSASNATSDADANAVGGGDMPGESGAPSGGSSGVYNVFGPAPSQHLMTPDELKKAGYNPGSVVQVDAKGNQIVRQKGRSADATGGLTSAAVDSAADQFIMTGKMPSLGLGATSLRTQIMNRAAEKVGGVASATNFAQYRALSSSLQKVTTQRGAIEAAEKGTMLNATTALLQAAKKDAPTGIPLINQPYNAISQALGGTKPGDLDTAIQGVVNEYARVMSGAMGGQNTSDAARAHAEQLFNRNMGYDQFKTNVARLKQEMDNRVIGLKQTEAQLTSQIRGMDVGQRNAPAAAPASGPHTQVNVPQGAVQMLKAHPELRGAFDEKYGSGASKAILGH